jgi:hypothetical protein
MRGAGRNRAPAGVLSAKQHHGKLVQAFDLCPWRGPGWASPATAVDPDSPQAGTSRATDVGRQRVPNVDGLLAAQSEVLEGLLEDLRPGLVRPHVFAGDRVVERKGVVCHGGVQIGAVDVGDDANRDAERVEETPGVPKQLWLLPVPELSSEELARVRGGAQCL